MVLISSILVNSKPWIFLQLTLAQLSFFLALTASVAEEIHWPPISNDREIAETLILIQETIPDLFNSLAEFNTDLFKVLSLQNQVNIQLGGNPKYAALIASRPDRKHIDILKLQPQTAVNNIVNLEEFEQFKRELITMLGSDSHHNQRSVRQYELPEQTGPSAAVHKYLLS